MPKSKHQKRLEALGRREANVEFNQRAKRGHTDEEWIAFYEMREDIAAADVRNLRRKLGIAEVTE